MKAKRFLQISEVLLLVLALGFTARAELRQGDLLGFSVDGREITAFIANPEGKTEYELDCQIGTKRPDLAESRLITEEPVPVRTLLLLDNSLSVRSEYRDRIREILQGLVDQHLDGEQYTIACFSDGIECLLTDSSDYAAVREELGKITYKDQETYLTDVLYELLSGREEEETPVFSRIIIVSDGVDNKDLGVTKEELNELLKEDPVPIYTLGCTSKNNGEQLKAMFALSRNTNGEGFLLDDLKDPSAFLNAVRQSDSTIRVTMVPAEEDLDGSSKGIRISLTTDAGTTQTTFTASMPFAELPGQTEEEAGETGGTGIGTISGSAAGDSSESENGSGAAPGAENTSLSTGEGESAAAGGMLPGGTAEQSEESAAGSEASAVSAEPGWKKFLPVAAVIGGLLLIAGLLFALLARKKKKGTEEYQGMDESPTVWFVDGDSPTEQMSDPDEAVSLPEPKLLLTDEGNGGEVYSAVLSKTLVVGRRQDCDIVIPDKTVSRQQFEAGREGYMIWIRNLSEQGTSVNGERIAGMQEVRTGDRITVGGLTLKVEIR